MALGPGLHIRQAQTLVMSQQLQQAIKLLALSNMELEAVIAEELAKNPLLGGPARRRRCIRRRHHPRRSGDRRGSDGPGRVGRADCRAARRSQFAARHGLAGGSARYRQFRRRRRQSAERRRLSTSTGWKRVNPRSPSISSPSSTAPAARWADCRGDRQRTRRDRLSRYAAASRSPRRWTWRWTRPRRRWPWSSRSTRPGVAARSLEECIALQAKAADRYDPAMARLIANLDLLARGQMKDLKRICGVDDEDLADMVAELRAYDPKPGCRFAGKDDAGAVRTRRARQALARRLDRSSSIPRPCRACWSTAATMPS